MLELVLCELIINKKKVKIHIKAILYTSSVYKMELWPLWCVQRGTRFCEGMRTHSNQPQDVRVANLRLSQVGWAEFGFELSSVLFFSTWKNKIKIIFLVCIFFSPHFSYVFHQVNNLFDMCLTPTNFRATGSNWAHDSFVDPIKLGMWYFCRSG